MLNGVAGTILVGYDDKEPAKRALERGIEEAKASGGRLVVVSVVEMPLNPEGPQNFGTLDDSPARMIPLVVPPELEPVQAHAEERMAAEGIRGELFWAVGDPAHEIVEAARERNASTVVVGSHHHSMLGRVFRLDVASEVERELGAKVIVVE
jgi:nucleotide-binding universal stress UspA family protein